MAMALPQRGRDLGIADDAAAEEADQREDGVELPRPRQNADGIVVDEGDEQGRQADADRAQDDDRARADPVGEQACRPGDQGPHEQQREVGAQELGAGPAELLGHVHQHVAQGVERHER
jgi:hypothetical protein